MKILELVHPGFPLLNALLCAFMAILLSAGQAFANPYLSDGRLGELGVGLEAELLIDTDIMELFVNNELIAVGERERK